MPAELDIDSFWERLRRSRLVPADDLEGIQRECKAQTTYLTSARSTADQLVDRELLTRWQADMLLKGKHKGFILGSYQLLDLLGKGGMGAVYLADHRLMRRRCAVKVLPSRQISKKSSVLERFYREAQAVAALDHPNIVRAYDVNKVVQNKNEVHYLVMEYLRGQDMQHLVRNSGVIDFIAAADYIRQAANGLAHAHEAGLVHRDVKPANLFVDTKGIVKILDLGLARFFEDPENASLSDDHDETVLGTADYLAPEQAVSSNVDARADIYGLGYTFYFCLTGHAPFPNGSVAQRLLAHQTKEPESIAKKRPHAPPDLLAIINKMVVKNPDERFQTAEDVAIELASWLLKHADEDWILQHPALISERARGTPKSRIEPTRAFSSAMDDTELDLLPLEGDSEESRASGSALHESGTSGDLSRAGSSNGLAADSSSRRAGESSGHPVSDDEYLFHDNSIKPLENDDSLAPLLNKGSHQPSGSRLRRVEHADPEDEPRLKRFCEKLKISPATLVISGLLSLILASMIAVLAFILM